MNSMPEPTRLNVPASPICLIDASGFCTTHEGVHLKSTEYGDGFAEGYLAALRQTVRLREQGTELEGLREQLLACPEWCVTDHAGDDPADPVDNLILHQAAEHFPGVCVSRTDCPSEGRIGTPCLYVRVELELETWEQAAGFAHAVLDGFGYLAGADQP
jgi:hypothetical protein